MANARVCSVNDCGKPVDGKGFCKKHYLRFHRYGDPLAGAPERVRNSGPCKVDGCDKPSKKKGFCTLHYERWRLYGDALAGSTPPGAAWDYYQNTVLAYAGNECLIWPFSTSSNGYGQVSDGTRTCTVSRMACEAENGPPPTPDHDAAHSCGRGGHGCVTRRHLVWKTRSENEADKVLHGTHNRGERNPMHKLTASEVQQIRALAGRMSQRAIAARFQIDQAAVSNIVRRKNWAWLD